ncbi:hypothetical protein [Sporolactobacillus pectinivorans]|uniref:hypothetical protein n=1 Tax=Sporolactobacillus pectinivorans TaxID=1591408 RepID=UPI0018753852|nr:hypothetical protein [Sporolactobacillus pectinivorans]
MNEEIGQFYDQRNVPSNLTNNYPMAENPGHHHDYKKIKGLCQKHLNHYVIGHLTDGRIIEGIILSVDDESVTMLIVEKDQHAREDDSRQFGRFPGFFRFSPFRVPFSFFGPPFFSPFFSPFFWI